MYVASAFAVAAAKSRGVWQSCAEAVRSTWLLTLSGIRKQPSPFRDGLPIIEMRKGLYDPPVAAPSGAVWHPLL